MNELTPKQELNLLRSLSGDTYMLMWRLQEIRKKFPCFWEYYLEDAENVYTGSIDIKEHLEEFLDNLAESIKKAEMYAEETND